MMKPKTLIVFLALAVAIATGFAARHLALREAIAAREEAIPGFLEKNSLLTKRCETRWTSRFKSWVLGIDTCDPWL